ncbi:MAG: DUF2252 domain-containing protein [Acidobacteria bacterium]|nr:MAG: DUF2252 domain-containing protein [Acidobacteriota bacterium]
MEPADGMSRADLKAIGRECRRRVPRDAHAEWTTLKRDRSVLALHRKATAGRIRELIPVRFGRMLANPFAYFRGAPAVMAHDLASLPNTGICTQSCGDAHLSNFGAYASPERRLVFDVNDFDETLEAPWECDIKRLASSIVIAGRDKGLDENFSRDCAVSAGRAYRELLAQMAELSVMEIWYLSIDVEEIAYALDSAGRANVKKAARKARKKDSLQAFRKLTEQIDGRARIRDNPPVVVHDRQTDDHARVRRLLRRYASTLPIGRRRLIDDFQVVDVARTVVGVGSVGTRCFLVLLAAKADGSPLLLQVKQALPSVLEPYAGASKWSSHAERVIEGQLLMQAASDPFLGHISANRRDFYVRQLRDMKGSADVDAMTPSGFMDYSQLCAATLARAHARSCHPSLISGYLGSNGKFDEALGEFAVAYADQNELDYEVMLNAAKAGRIVAESDL